MAARPERQRPRIMTERERAALLRIERMLEREFARILSEAYRGRPGRPSA